jgi:ribonuclease D
MSPGTLLITETEQLAEFCRRQAVTAYVTVDTEFMREKTYWPQLCLVQVAGPDEAAAIDALAPQLDLGPLVELMADPKVLKVFHAARQDIEIFYHLTGSVPAPLFDTQVAAMVCGFGDSVGYETLATKLAGGRIDKSSRFTDWAQRPLTERQLQYAIADVTYLRTVFEKLRARLDRTGRAGWLDEEMAELTDPAIYRVEPSESWRRFKLRGNSNRQFLAVLQSVAAWREVAAQQRNLPRNRILRDEAVLEIAAHSPKTIADLARMRSVGKGIAEGRLGGDILAAVERGLAAPASAVPQTAQRADLPPGLGPIIDLLRVVLKLRCEEHGVAQKLVASAEDLELIAADDKAEVRALSGWRHELFGRDALDVKHGRLALTASGKQVKLVRLSEAALPEAAAAAR